ncbi:MAG TPA: PTS sugar transporter subunit IIA [Opitutus sp.]|nr:PTS sugar transporter subunit IIA [Opitutus sp.]
MQSPSELISHPDVVMLDLPGGSRETVLRTLHGRLAGNPAVLDADRLLRDVLERVMLATVCVSADTALPHARTNAVSRIVLAVARLAPPGVAFDPEHPQIRLVFLIGTPRAEVDSYLRLVGSISRLLRDPAAHDALLAAKSEPEFRAVLAGEVKA